jgi:MoaA/NifB/PqqE/SkfB family radical SAM enzyme
MALLERGIGCPEREMMGFFEGGIRPLVSSVLTHRQPLYVQYYVTARCNLRCQQCNVIYANGDQEECSLDQAKAIAANLAKIGTSIVLLTGGEPFARSDLPEIAEAFIKQGIHPRIQTNGFASQKQLERMVEVGVKDISISLDSLSPGLQETINGGVEDSWHRALEKVVEINEIFPPDAFCAFGCVLAPSNIDQVPGIVKFATEIGWWVSLVPAHQSSPRSPRSFATYDRQLVFAESDYPKVQTVLQSVHDLKQDGYNLYDSDEYLKDIYRYITRNPITWRRRNQNVCDAPNLYFAIQPNGDMSVCCDYRLSTKYPVWDPKFPDQYAQQLMNDEAHEVAKACSGCMYGSFPEITISARYFKPMFQRAVLFATDNGQRSLKKVSFKELLDLASQFNTGGGVA